MAIVKAEFKSQLRPPVKAALGIDYFLAVIMIVVVVMIVTVAPVPVSFLIVFI